MIASRLKEIKERLPEHVTLVAVSKYHPIERLQEAYDVGQRVFGENRVQEMVEKAPLMPDDTEWHMIGTLQRNKVKYIAPFVTMIESVDSIRLAEEIVKQAIKCDRRIDCLVELKVASDDSKSGMPLDQVKAFVERYWQDADWQKYIRIRGFMGMASLTDDEVQLQGEFCQLKQLFDHYAETYRWERFDTLSMGMSGDWPIAVDEGSTLIRVGSLIFGPREY